MCVKNIIGIVCNTNVFHTDATPPSLKSKSKLTLKLSTSALTPASQVPTCEPTHTSQTSDSPPAPSTPPKPGHVETALTDTDDDIKDQEVKKDAESEVSHFFTFYNQLFLCCS